MLIPLCVGCNELKNFNPVFEIRLPLFYNITVKAEPENAFLNSRSSHMKRYPSVSFLKKSLFSFAKEITFFPWAIIGNHCDETCFLLSQGPTHFLL